MLSVHVPLGRQMELDRALSKGILVCAVPGGMTHCGGTSDLVQLVGLGLAEMAGALGAWVLCPPTRR